MKTALVTGTRTHERRGVISEALRRYGPDFVLIGDAPGVDTEAAALCKAEGYDHAIAPALWDKYGNPAGPRRNHLLAFLAAAVAHYTASAPKVFAVPWGEARGTNHCAKVACAGMDVEWL